VIFDDTTYHLAYIKENSTASINEYILPEKTLENWDKMVALHVFHHQSNITPAQFAQRLGEAVKTKNPKAGFRVISNPHTEEAMIDFMTWTNEDPLISEFNIFKFKIGSKPGDILGYQYAFRTYGNSVEEFKKEFSQNRERLVSLMKNEPYPPFVTEADR
jgi:hypothetical protein